MTEKRIQYVNRISDSSVPNKTHDKPKSTFDKINYYIQLNEFVSGYNLLLHSLCFTIKTPL